MEKLGIQLPIIITQVANFAILLFILQKFLYKPVLKKLDERKAKAAALLDTERALSEKEQSLDTLKKAALKQAKEDAAKIISEAKKQAKEEREELIKKTQADLLSERKKLESEMAARFQQLSQDMSRRTVDIASEMVKRVLAQSLDTADQRKLVKDSIDKLHKLNG